MATVALFVGWAITVAIASGGWIVSQAQARRDTRRTMRIRFLLDAYRRLDRASNRPRNDDTARELETAVSDIFLLGTPSQAELAGQFAATFAADSAAEAKPLLVNLRDSLRRESGLERLPPTHASFRITPDSDSVTDRARIWRETSQDTYRSLEPELASQDLPAELAALPQATSPSAAIADSYQQVERALSRLVATSTTGDVSAFNLAQLANRALQHKLIDARLADTLNGLSAMRLLAAIDQDRIDSARAAEFTTYATVALYLLDIASRRPQPT